MESVGHEGLTVRDSLLLIAYSICEAECELASLDGRWLDWQGDPEQFSPNLGLKAHLDKSVAARDFTILEATLSLLDEDMSVGLTRTTEDGLDDDPFAMYIRDGFLRSFARSPRQLCFDGLAQRLRAAQTQSTPARMEPMPGRREPPKVTDKRTRHIARPEHMLQS